MGITSRVVLGLAAALAPLMAGEPALSLVDLLAEAEASSPALRAAAARIEAAATRPDQAAALDDPLLSLALDNESLDAWTVGDSQMSNLTLAWSQELPYPGKRAARADAARAESGVATADAARVRAEVRARVKVAYIELHRIHRARGLVEESRRIVESLRDASRAKFESGGAPLEGTLGAGSELARLAADSIVLDGERAEIEARLAALLGRADHGTFGEARDAPVVAPFDADALARAATKSSTRVATLDAAARRDVARIESLKHEGKPDFEWSAGYGYRESLDPIVSGMFGVRLPLFRDRKQRLAVAEAEHNLAALREDTAEAEIAAAAEVREALARAAAAEAGARMLEQSVLPQARAALDAATVAYSAGRADFGTLLVYVRASLDDARRIEELHARRRIALAAIEPSVGAELIVPSGGPP